MSLAASMISGGAPGANAEAMRQYGRQLNKNIFASQARQAARAQAPYMSGPAVGGPANGQMLYMPPVQLGAPSFSWTGGSAQAATPQQQAMQAQMEAARQAAAMNASGVGHATSLMPINMGPQNQFQTNAVNALMRQQGYANGAQPGLYGIPNYVVGAASNSYPDGYGQRRMF